MDADTYELLALAARYWFILLAALIVLRGWRACVKDNRKERLVRDWVGSAGSIGELVVTADGQRNRKRSLRGARYPVGVESLVGSGSIADIRIHHADVKRRHVWMHYRRGCMVLTPHGKAQVSCPALPDGKLVLRDGDRMRIGKLELMMVFYDVNDAAPAQPTVALKQRRGGRRLAEDAEPPIEENFWE